MLDEEEYASDTSDEDFHPDKCDDSGEDDEDNQAVSDEEGEETNKRTKKDKNRKGNKRQKIEKGQDESTNDKKQETKNDDRKEASLWADFLADVEDKPVASLTKPSTTKHWSNILGTKKSSKDEVTSNVSKESVTSGVTKKPDSEKVAPPERVKVTKVFQFAGEEVRVHEEVPVDLPESREVTSKTDDDAKDSTGTKRPLGLSGLLGLIDSKKKKLTTLEKTKIDWTHFKKSEHLEEDLEAHKKSKSGFLEKQAFLERSDLREFEIEKATRMKKRKKISHLGSL